MTQADRKKSSWSSWVLWGSVFACIVLFIVFNCSGLTFGFLNAKQRLNGHLTSRFGLMLPTAARVTQGQWIAYRDPEELYEVEMTPEEVAGFLKSVKKAAEDRSYELSYGGETLAARQVQPSLRRPSWWNHPPVVDGTSYTVMIQERGITAEQFSFLVSPSTGRSYIVWGRF